MSILATGDQATVQVLRNEIRHLEAVSRQDQGQVYSTGCVAVDCWLPKGGLGAGTVTEWLTPQTKGAFGAKPGSVLAGGKQDGHAAGGYGAEILSLIATREACAAGGALVVIDPWHQFYPPAAAAWGISLEHTLVLRCRDPKEMLWAIDQALRCSGRCGGLGMAGVSRGTLVKAFSTFGGRDGDDGNVYSFHASTPAAKLVGRAVDG